RPRDLLDRDLEHQRPCPGAAVLGGERQREDVVLGEQLADVPRVLAAAVDLRRARPDSILDDPADRLAEVAELLGDLVDAAHARTRRELTRARGRERLPRRRPPDPAATPASPSAAAR